MIFELLTCIGISYKKSNTNVRSKFGLTPLQLSEIYKSTDLKHIMILSTCNRTEIYSFDNTDDDLFNLVGGDDVDLFKKESYTIKGREAFEHLINVTAGIDSQLLGDYEISGQVKDAMRIAEDNGKLGGYFQKITNFAQSISKSIRSKTNLSKGSISVSKAASDWLSQNVKDIQSKNILVIGAGKMGRSTMKYMLEQNATQITLVNRTESVSDKIADELNIGKDSFNNLYSQIKVADIILVAINSPNYIIEPFHINNKKVIVDLSIPNNVNPNCKGVKKSILVDVDELSKVKDETLKMRKGELEKANQIIKERLDKFEEQINQGFEFFKK